MNVSVSAYFNNIFLGPTLPIIAGNVTMEGYAIWLQFNHLQKGREAQHIAAHQDRRCSFSWRPAKIRDSELRGPLG